MTANSNQLCRCQSTASGSGSVAALNCSQISQANNGWVGAMEHLFPATSSLNHRTRGAAQSTPALPPDPNLRKSTINIDPLAGQRYINIDVHVSLPTDLPNTILHLPQFIYAVLGAVAIFEWLLGLANKGNRSKEGDIYMRRQPASCTQTLSDLLADRILFAKQKILVRHRRLIIKFVVANFGITGLADRRSPSGPPHCHSCLFTLMHDIFSVENEKGRASGWTPPQCESDGETDNDSDIEGLHDFLTPQAAQQQGAATQVSNVTSGSTVTLETRVAPQPRSATQVPQPPVVYPQVRNGDLWDGPWVPQPAKYGGLFDI
ncbi:hypothetical protein B0H16DRAFT_1476521 [Mycena metata]|uniref:Uncharacterized protein n=1 Tax=Mycena metata TaxID=1033252 RepID=A0AAD7MGS8_9AGAR|nr:hypothetical protein B0H16DRAFT_1476521 [Mycena metata]